MDRPHLILAHNLDYFAQGIILILGGLLLLLFSAIIFLVLYVTLRVWLFRRRQRRAREEYLRHTRRADGKTYPPQGGGLCEQCGRVKTVVYFLPGGEKLCHPCYEAWWPVAEAEKAEAPVPALTVDRDATRPQTRPARSDDRKPAPA